MVWDLGVGVAPGVVNRPLVSRRDVRSAELVVDASVDCLPSKDEVVEGLAVVLLVVVSLGDVVVLDENDGEGR